VKRDASGNFSAGGISAESVSGNGSGLTNLNGANLAAASVAADKLSPGAALTNLQQGGQSGVPSGGLVLSATSNTALANAGYIQLGTVTTSDGWLQGGTVPLTAGYLHTAVWTGSEMIVWGGNYITYYPNQGARYSPAAHSWSFMSTLGAPTG